MTGAPHVRGLILSVLADIEPLMAAAFEAVGGHPAEGSSLDQVNLSDGREVIEDYLEHGEYGCAFDHLVFMIVEPPLSVPGEAFDRLKLAAQSMDLPVRTLDRIQVDR